MSILIKGMEMPKSCDDCYIANCPNDISYTDRGKGSRHINCPIIEVPEPHGELIDMDDFLSEWSELESYRMAMRLCGVIPASEKEE